MNQEQLTALFQKLGASEPEDWTHSLSTPVEEGIPPESRTAPVSG